MMQFNLLVLSFVSVTLANNWATYPEVPKTASINGFADPLYSKLPKCARECVEASTGNTPCPYWDTGCLCVMPQWSGLVGQCIAEKCSGEAVVSATSLAYSLCSSVGANVWLMPSSITAALTSAAGEYNEAAPTPTETAWNTLLDDEDSDDEDSSAEAKTTSSAKTTTSAKSSSSATTDSSSSATEDSSSSTSSAQEDSESSSASDVAMKASASVFTVIVGSLLALIM